MKRKILLGAAVGSLAFTGNALAAQKQGVVVKVDRPGKLVVIAGAHGRVMLLHARVPARLRLGARVGVAVRPLANGAFAATRIRMLGTARKAHVRGMVLARRSGTLFVSARGALLRLKMLGRKVRSLSAATAAPAVGSAVDATVLTTDGGLAAEQVRVLDPSGNAGALQGTVTAVGTGTITVADDGVAVTLTVPVGIDLSGFTVGDEVLAYFSQQADGSFALTALAGDENAVQANDESQVEGNIEEAQTDVAADESNDSQVQVDDVDDGQVGNVDDGEANNVDDGEQGQKDEGGDAAPSEEGADTSAPSSHHDSGD